MASSLAASLPEPREWRLPWTSLPFVRPEPDGGANVLHLLVEGVHCGACVRKIERTLEREGDLLTARVNLTTRRLTLRWQGEARRGNRLAQAVAALGYGVVPFDPDRLRALDDRSERELLRCVAVAGFAASNVMLLAVSVWAGHFSGMGDATRDLPALVRGADRPPRHRLCRPAVLPLGRCVRCARAAPTWTCRSRWR